MTVTSRAVRSITSIWEGSLGGFRVLVLDRAGVGDLHGGVARHADRATHVVVGICPDAYEGAESPEHIAVMSAATRVTQRHGGQVITVVYYSGAVVVDVERATAAAYPAHVVTGGFTDCIPTIEGDTIVVR